LIAGPAKPLETDEKRAMAVDDTIAALASTCSSKLVGVNNPPPLACTKKNGLTTGKPPTTYYEGKRISAIEDFSKKVFGTKTFDGTKEECSKCARIVTTEKPKASGAGEEPSMSTEDEDTS
jgi:hypothetical protein